MSPVDPDQQILRKIGRKVRKRLAANKAARKVGFDKAELWVVSDFFDAIECGRLISMINVVARPSIALGYGSSNTYRTSYSGDLDAGDPFVQSLQKRIDGLLGIDPANGERLEGQRYQVGQEFKAHRDWFPLDQAAGVQEAQFGGQRAFTAMAFLNDVEAGGETAFPDLGIAIVPKPGTLLVWNNADEDGVPNPWTIHAGTPVTRGIKYIVTKWYRCHPWVGH